MLFKQNKKKQEKRRKHLTLVLFSDRPSLPGVSSSPRICFSWEKKMTAQDLLFTSFFSHEVSSHYHVSSHHHYYSQTVQSELSGPTGPSQLMPQLQGISLVNTLDKSCIHSSGFPQRFISKVCPDRLTYGPHRPTSQRHLSRGAFSHSKSCLGGLCRTYTT